jgi:leucyl aminopeptidase (aminopeptidase T)
MNSDVDVRCKLDPHYLKKGIKAGTYANIPGGEMFLSPEWMKGTFYGDVVISIDKSYVLNSKNPLVIKCDEKGYKIIGGPKDVIKKINAKKNESMKVLLKQEKNKSLPKEIIKMKKDNFNQIGEFAINTNPKAELCNYLIVNEKIAGMIHIALGSGFEDDRATLYHYDIVINAKEQKLDIYGIKGKKKHWMMKKGKLVA